MTVAKDKLSLKTLPRIYSQAGISQICRGPINNHLIEQIIKQSAKQVGEIMLVLSPLSTEYSRVPKVTNSYEDPIHLQMSVST